MKSFNPLALESGWKDHHGNMMMPEEAGFNPLALESGWKALRVRWFDIQNNVSIRLRWRVVGKLRTVWTIKWLRRGFNPLALESGWKVPVGFNINTIEGFNPLALESGWKAMSVSSQQ